MVNEILTFGNIEIEKINFTSIRLLFPPPLLLYFTL